MTGWTFLSNHGIILAYIAQYGDVSAEQIARELQLTERTVRRIVADLTEAGYLEKERIGRSNTYKIHIELPLRHPQHRDVKVGDLLRVLRHAVEGEPAKGQKT